MQPHVLLSYRKRERRPSLSAHNNMQINTQELVGEKTNNPIIYDAY